MKRLSSDTDFRVACISKHATPQSSIQENEHSNILPGQFVACVYERKWYVGNITERSNENQDCLVSFMKRNDDIFSWPNRKDCCWIPFSDVLCVISAPAPQSHGARFYKLPVAEYKKIVDRFSNIISLE